MANEFYESMDKSFKTITSFLNDHSISEILQNHNCEVFESFFYAKIIKSFFLSLNQHNMEEYGLSLEKIPKIKQKYEKTLKDVDLILLKGYEIKNVNKEYYNGFKSQVEIDFPELTNLIFYIEKEIDMEKANEYLLNKKDAIKNAGKETDWSDHILIKGIETYITEKNYFPADEDLNKLLKTATDELIPEISKKVVENLKSNIKEVLDNKRYSSKEVEMYLYEKWKEPLDLLECLIKVSFDSGERHANKQDKVTEETDFKLDALVQIHARALHISNEILVLLKAGYPDGANARWRSLHELAVTSAFLKKNNNEVSKRYLEYRTINVFKDAQEYQKYYKKLGYPPMKTSDFEIIKNKKERLCTKYGDNFDKKFGWIPPHIFKVRNFKDFEMKVGDMDAWRPFYSSSSASIHANPSGFHRLGLKDDQQYKVLLTGPSDRGLDNPLQTTAISLMHISNSLLSLRPDFECIRDIHVIKGLGDEINVKSFEIQDAMKK